jgi:hypothetical protein
MSSSSSSSEQSTSSGSNSSAIHGDWFCWLVEGVLILAIGIVGLLGNSFSLVVFSRQKVHKIFHNLLLALTIFDMVRNDKKKGEIIILGELEAI